MRNSKETVQRNIKRLMQENNITLEELALSMNYESKSSVSKQINGRNNALSDLTVLEQYAKVFKVNVLDLLKENVNMLENYPAPDEKIGNTLWHIFLKATNACLVNMLIEQDELEEFNDYVKDKDSDVLFLPFPSQDEDNLMDIIYLCLSNDSKFTEWIRIKESELQESLQKENSNLLKVCALTPSQIILHDMLVGVSTKYLDYCNCNSCDISPATLTPIAYKCAKDFYNAIVLNCENI